MASAARATDISRSFQLFPEFLRQLRPLMVELGNLADQGTPLMASLGQSASALGRQFANLTPFAKPARPALIALGNSAPQVPAGAGRDDSARAAAQEPRHAAVPTRRRSTGCTASLDQTGAIEQLMSVLFYGTAAANGFDSVGHYVRDEPLVGDCTTYDSSPSWVLGQLRRARRSASCGAARTASSSRPRAAADGHRSPPRRSRGLLDYLIGSGG